MEGIDGSNQINGAIETVRGKDVEKKEIPLNKNDLHIMMTMSMACVTLLSISIKLAKSSYMT